MKKALLVIDVQKYFLEKASKGLPSKIADHIKSSKYEFLAFTTFRNIAGSNWEKSLGWKKCQSDKDLELPKEFENLVTPDNIFEKHTYSALKSPDKLLEHLRRLKIEEIDLCGIDTEACVLATAYDAFDQGFKTNVLFGLSYSRSGLGAAAKAIINRTIQKPTNREDINMQETKLYTDGGSRGNPGHSAGAFVICKMDNNVVEKSGFYIGITTNNQAEYQALLKGLQRTQVLGIRKLNVFMDSELIVKQLNGLYKIKNKGLEPLYLQVKDLVAGFEEISFTHVSRALNKEADEEVNRILDEKAAVI
ncbi:MAG: isochorismatase family protein [Patescibacteria group bacterium]